MDQETQIQAIIDKVTGAPPETLPPPEALEQPWRAVYQGARPVDGFFEAETLLARITRSLPGGRALARQLIALLPSDAFGTHPCLDQISDSFTEVGWLWPFWIPRGMLTLSGAAPGAGKSLVALDLARRVIHGEPWPDGAPPGSGGPPSGGGRNVLIVDAEGTPALLTQRARAWGIDGSCLYLMQAPGGGLIELSATREQMRLYEMCRTIQPALVVIDSLAAATAHGETSLEAARAILGFLGTIARKGHLALLVIHHLRKGAGRGAHAVRVAAEDLRGSSHISAAARSVMALSVIAPYSAGVRPPPAAGSRFDGPRLLEIFKTNLCCHPPPLSLIIEGDGLGVPTLRYTEYVEPAPEPSRKGLCAGWLFQYLQAAAGPVKPVEAIVAAGKQGYSRTTLYRARTFLGGLVVDLGQSPHDPNKRWALASTIPEIDIKKR